jgi:hypothetical protein
MSRGNRKLHSCVAVWSLPAGRTCPGAGKCKQYCYAFKVQKGLNGVVLNARWNNFRASLRPDFVQRTVALILSLHVVAVRVHESGDFYNQTYLNMWAEIARQLPQIRFFAFTKSLHLDLTPLTSLENFTVIKSFDGVFDSVIDKTTDNYAKVIDNAQDVEAGEHLCIARTTKRQSEKVCGNTCTYCFEAGHKVKVCFLKHTKGWNGNWKAK